MIPTKQGLFKDPLWSLTHPQLTESPNQTPSSSESIKEEDKLHPINRSEGTEQTTIELTSKCVAISEPIEKLKVDDQDGLSSSGKVMILEDEGLQQSAFIVRESPHQDAQSEMEELFLFEDLCSRAQPEPKYRILSKEVKEFLVEQAGRTSITCVSRKYGVPQNSLNRWRKGFTMRKPGCGRKIADREMEAKLIEWLKVELQKQNCCITKRDIQNQAIIFSSDGKFKASKGWLSRFVGRNNKELRLAEYLGMNIFKGRLPRWGAFENLGQIIVQELLEASKKSQDMQPQLKLNHYPSRSSRESFSIYMSDDQGND